ncbi:(E)-4-hydroxy-3-methylbut-2-enyl-diphosphate synthase [Hymenobacter taeanensis]|uniref:4-hydroxy-3-methylbut-2-en-1-yl diphosphate synthase (flavodoxin) n=1 Tax=Hymenobacter taeanensis TaxID=2735321 RepID=A0A6M6BKW6_9BACT|nr:MULTISPECIES: (E)-4-hydroxy-3-methylbut-2-enyl-diphosphate synthase [Hymenobacter]QJX48756.1 (E)-4-hydroxy-3-methylbut-2-enyl-diphosphate synthase [Hymenobacter taeanensis]UOQ81738.1 (E)-4-hydroxy-3-methylbut-2-enyl-diphosphate synthase [Hymenobacter sp. 5414T-23]
MNKTYCPSLTEYKRRLSREVQLGDLPMGGLNPIRVQSMTTVDTMDTLGSVEQTLRMVEAGCEYVRITAPSVKEAQNLLEIKKELRKRGCNVPLIADIHFTPNAAELAARIVEKVRVNPGNYADKKKFDIIEYTDATYAAEVERIRERFRPLVQICKQYGTAMRIGTNHGSLSDRILSRYGDTPLGMVESALEFLRLCEEENYYNVVLSMKASNTQVMVQAYRLLVQKLDAEGLQPYPLHLGVTEAGEAEDGRIKSAVGIGTLLEDGLGDTVRVSLTEAPEAEAPVAKALIDRYTNRAAEAKPITPLAADFAAVVVNNAAIGQSETAAVAENDANLSPIDPFQYHRRATREVLNIGGQNVPRVMADLSRLPGLEYADLRAVGHLYSAFLDKFQMNDLGADYVYSGQRPIPFMLPNGLKEVVDFSAWVDGGQRPDHFPVFTQVEFATAEVRHPELNFVFHNLASLTEEALSQLHADATAVVILYTDNAHAMPEIRRAFFRLINKQITNPVIINRQYPVLTPEQTQLYAATDVGGLLLDGLGDGVVLSTELLLERSKEEWLQTLDQLNQLSFGILQAARTRMSKTEYISCPSCGRTLFDLQETTAMIRKRTDHLKGVKIGIMGCIVNGPGEMADADYGYVGVGKGKIALYRGQEVIKKSVPEEQAVDQLIDLMREDGKWIEPVVLEEPVIG